MGKNIKLSKKDFDTKECEKILLGKEFKVGIYTNTCFNSIFGGAVGKAREKGELEKAKIYQLFAAACSMMLEPNEDKEIAGLVVEGPFFPLWIMDGKRSCIVNDFSKEDIVFFSEIVEDVENAWLRARLADVVWVKLKNQKYALMAIDAYSTIFLNAENFNMDVNDCWNRAINLALKVKNVERISKLKEALNKAFFTAEANKFFALRVSRLLCRFNIDNQEKKLIAEKLERIAKEFKKENELYEASYYFEEAAKLYKILDKKEFFCEMVIAQADILCERAKIGVEEGRNSSANLWYEQAIQKLRGIPNADRVNFKISERIKELRDKLSESGERVFDEMVTVSSTIPAELVQKQIDSAIKHVQGKGIFNTLAAFANISDINYEKMKVDAIKMMQNTIVADMPATHYHRDGRVIGKTDGIDFNSGNNDLQVHVTMMRNYSAYVDVTAQIIIMPALQTIKAEHNFTEEDFLKFAQESPFVPPCHEELFAKGLFAGYSDDLITAMHILPFQLEALVRYHLKRKDVETTTIDNDGIEAEVGLSALMNKPEIEKIFCKDMDFEIEALFCDPLFANLRNEVGHGLVKQDEFDTTACFYAWWLVFKLVFNTYAWAIQGSKKKEK
ncbi:MAG: DUF4209 domain-containing protein [Endozoicomonadaceae bacterium]|nr:DUF4209 domain-containing protein [Endozoicomonadaceae bacterium]